MIPPPFRFPCLFAVLLASAGQSTAQISFTDASATLLNNGSLKGGVAMAVVDMNGDGKDDIVRLDGARDLEIEYQQAPNQLFGYLDVGDLDAASSVAELSLCVADVDKNGFNDIVVGGFETETKLLTANGTGTGFSVAVLPDSFVAIQSSNLADINNDGELDIFLCNDVGVNLNFRGTGAGAFVRDQSLIDTRVVATDPPVDPDVPNSGNYASLWTDYDNDGDLDLYISKCKQGEDDPAVPTRINQLFQNDGSNNYTEVGAIAGMASGEQTWCTAFGDIDNDGDLDCFLINHVVGPNDGPSQLFENNGDGTFSDITTAAGFDAATELEMFGIQAAFADFDNDGFVDLVISSTAGGSHRLFRNNGNKTFGAKAIPFGGTSLPRVQSFALGDLNSDGFVDAITGYASQFNFPSSFNEDKVWINAAAGNGNHYLAVRCAGTTSNINGIGARIEIHGAWGIQVREVRSGEGYGVTHSLTQYFGTGSVDEIDRVVVRWPSGTIDEVFFPAPDQVLTVIEGSSPNPLPAWQHAHFTPAEVAIPSVGGLFGDAEFDLLANLVEFGLDLDPRSGNSTDGPSGLPFPEIAGAGPARRLALRCNLPESAPSNVIYEVRAASADLTPAGWTVIAVKKGGGSWSGAATVHEDTPSGGRIETTVEDTELVGAAPSRFLRLVIRLLAEPAS